MATITLEKDLAKDLIESKIRILDEEITSILLQWNVSSIEEFIQGAKDGTYSEAEDSAIELQNLNDKRKELEKLLLSIM